MRLKERLYRFMYGRYGGDDLSQFLVGVLIALCVIDIFVEIFIETWFISLPLTLLRLGLAAWIFFRIFSKNICMRQKENFAFLRIKRKIKEFFQYLKNKWKYRKTHVYKKCPSCKSKLKLPRKKGIHNVKCPKCSNNFSVKI